MVDYSISKIIIVISVLIFFTGVVKMPNDGDDLFPIYSLLSAIYFVLTALTSSIIDYLEEKK